MVDFFYTSRFKEIRRQNETIFPQFVKDFLEHPNVSQIHRYKDKVFIKRFNGEGYARLLFFEENDEHGNTLYVPRKYFRKHEEYDDFFAINDFSYIKQRARYDTKEWQEIQNRFAEMIVPESLPNLPLEKQDIEGNRDFSNIGTSYVFEMEEWVRNICNVELEDDKRDIYRLLQAIVVDKKIGSPNSRGWYTDIFEGGKSIVYRVQSEDDHTYIYLFDIGSHVNIEKLEHKYVETADTIGNGNQTYQYSKDELYKVSLSNAILLKKAKKGYPDWIMYGELKDWKMLENNDQANLALSDEEIDVLNNTPYPYFVNGLAGSGKSTILYYLFAHAYAHRLSQKTAGKQEQSMLFLSYSENLIEKANEAVLSLLMTNPSYIDVSHLMNDEQKDLLKQCFSPFIKFLVNHFLTTSEELEKFSEKRHISYHKFQKLYVKDCKLNEKNNYSSSIVWSVIRSFIKGRNYREFFDVKKYGELNCGDRTITEEDYKDIFLIYKNWYSSVDGWDDLDLIRYVLNKMDREPYKKYDIIYCDEAQDFTPIENKLVIRLSSYTDYNLNNYKKIPIAYAGDPNQTVSPTGFSWNRLKDVFNNSFKEQLGGDFIKFKDNNVKTLNNNYRSKRTIVKFANSIQYIRKCFLTDDALKPQEQWNPQANPMPGFFFLDSVEDKNNAKKCLEKVEFIITGQEGEYNFNEENIPNEESTPLSDELLLSVNNKRKLHTAISSKGLEGNSAILYSFADTLPNSFSKLLEGKVLSESERYDLSHFFTKLYIAVSRSKDLLYIFDTKANFDRFWHLFIDNQFVNNLLEKRSDLTTWNKKVGGIELGQYDNAYNRLSGFFDPSSWAEKTYKSAKESKNPQEMRNAVGYFEEAQDYQCAKKAMAYVYLFEDEYDKAGKLFDDLGCLDEATNAYWKGECWEDLKQQNEKVHYRLAAQFMSGDLSFVDFIITDNIILKISYSDEVWRSVVLKMRTAALSIPQEYTFDVCEKLTLLVERGFLFLNETIAKLYFNNKKYVSAIKKWDEIRNTEHPDYYEAKEQTVSESSEKIYWMYRGQKNVEILRMYGGNDDAINLNLDERARSIIFSLWLNPSTFKKALSYPYSGDDKLSRLYRTDKLQFLEHYVLEDFDSEKYTSWVENKVRDMDVEIFDKTWSFEIFRKLFNATYLNEKGIQFAWLDFVGLRDEKQYRLMKNEENQMPFLEHLVTQLDYKDPNTGKKDWSECKRRSYCMMDFCFDSSYNFKRAYRFDNALQSIFRNLKIYRNEFLVSLKKNAYFESVGIQPKDADILKDNMRNYAKEAINALKRIKNTDMDRFQIYCRIIEKALPLSRLEGRDFDYDSLNEYYTSLKKKSKEGKLLESTEALKYVEIRLFLNNLYVDRVDYKEWLANVEEKSISSKEFLDTLDTEDFTNFLRKISNQEALDCFSLEWFSLIVEQMYKHHFKLDDFEGSQAWKAKNNMRNFFSAKIDSCIDELLSASNLDEYTLKLMAYVWERLYEKHSDIAAKYDVLIKRLKESGRERITRLLDYFEERALVRYARYNKVVFAEKSKEYGLYRSIDSFSLDRPEISKDGKSSTNKPIEVKELTEDITIETIDVELNAKRKKITFYKDDQELLEISKGQINADIESITIKGSSAKLLPNFDVFVQSENEVIIVAGGEKYRVKF